jgi:hypothetical protein
MRAKFVRGQDPKQAMGLGIVSKIDNLIKSQNHMNDWPMSSKDQLEDWEIASWTNERFARGKDITAFISLLKEEDLKQFPRSIRPTLENEKDPDGYYIYYDLGNTIGIVSLVRFIEKIVYYL